MGEVYDLLADKFYNGGLAESLLKFALDEDAEKVYYLFGNYKHFDSFLQNKVIAA